MSLTGPFAVVSPAMTPSIPSQWRAALAVSHPWYSGDVSNTVPSGSTACSCQVSTLAAGASRPAHHQHRQRLIQVHSATQFPVEDA